METMKHGCFVVENMKHDYFVSGTITHDYFVVENMKNIINYNGNLSEQNQH